MCDLYGGLHIDEQEHKKLRILQSCTGKIQGGTSLGVQRRNPDPTLASLNHELMILKSEQQNLKNTLEYIDQRITDFEKRLDLFSNTFLLNTQG